MITPTKGSRRGGTPGPLATRPDRGLPRRRKQCHGREPVVEPGPSSVAPSADATVAR